MQVSKVKDTVKKYLEKYPSCRDNDQELIARIWWKEAIEKQEMDLKTFLGEFKDGKFSHPESIMRCRRKLQELHVELRGTNYKDRQAEQEVVIDDLKYI